MTVSTRFWKPSAKSRNELGRYQQRRRAVLAVLIVLIFMSLLFVRSATAPDGALHQFVEAFGLGLIVIAILGRTWCTLYIGGRKSSEIVRGGPYSVTRNPLYVFSTIGAAGIGALTGSIVVTVVLAVLCCLAFHSVIFVEEAYLEESFGEPYRQYMREVPRFLPNPALFKESEMLSVRPQNLYRTFTDGLVFFAAYPFFEFIEYLQQAGTLPVLLRLY
jgi:protein-S-isoprenylcysteine O-methyltransferase Ste14